VIEQKDKEEWKNLEQCEQRNSRIGNLLRHQAGVHKWSDKDQHPHQEVECALADKLLADIYVSAKFHLLLWLLAFSH
jgi:hypothetical protein